MTWGEFKKSVERQGVRDSDGLFAIDVDFLPDEHLLAAQPKVYFTTLEKEVYVFGVRPKRIPRLH